jgi:hypothetical protein
MGPTARPTAAVQGFSLASPRPGGGPPSGRPTSELLGSATFQTPEGEPPTPLTIFFVLRPPYAHLLFSQLMLSTNGLRISIIMKSRW